MTIADIEKWLKENHRKTPYLARLADVSENHLRAVLKGRFPLTGTTLEKLKKIIKK